MDTPGKKQKKKFNGQLTYEIKLELTNDEIDSNERKLTYGKYFEN